MLHLLLLLGSLAIALGLRGWWGAIQRPNPWQERWNLAWVSFVLPPLLLLNSAIALLWMGPLCHMLHHVQAHGWQSFVSYGLVGYDTALIYLSGLLLVALQLMSDGQQSIGRLAQYQLIELTPTAVPTWARLLPTAVPFIAQVGWWKPQLVVSQGVLDRLTPEQLAAVLQHEAAHNYYQDTRWFTALGILRRCSHWLPQSESLWQELLFLRELRADRWAAQSVDPLLLAEALFTIASAPLSLIETPEFAVGFYEACLGDRLTERVDALLAVNSADAMVTGPASSVTTGTRDFSATIYITLALSLLPLLSLVWH
jgi:Zn-dependent protease with chaperone function